MGKTIEGYTKGPIRSKKIIRLVLVVFISILVMMLAVRVMSGLQKLVILPVRKVQIYGTRYVKNNRILEAVKLDAVKSLISFNKMRAKASLLKDKRIKGVEIAKIYPDTLKIYIVEKNAEMLLYTEIKNIIIEIKKSINAVEKSGSRKTRNDITEITRKGGKKPL